MNKLLVIGASGSGTTTIGRMLAARLENPHFETDDLFWLKTDPPYTTYRSNVELKELIRAEILTKDDWVLSGSPCGWGDSIIPFLDLVIFLIVPTEVRTNRISRREKVIFGDKILEGGSLYESHQNFLNWTRSYDKGGVTGRTRNSHEDWLLKLSCPILRFEGNIPIEKILGDVRKLLRV